VNHVVEKGPPANVPGFLTEVVRKEVANHKRRWRPEIQHGADADAEMSNAPDPEGTAELAERSAKLERYLVHLPVEEAEAIRCIDLFELTLEQTAQAVRRPRSTVAAQHARAKEKLKEMARESERATTFGARRQRQPAT
jgi:RNA polymerase sigma factor (sigma-70 family)